jgi:hypothetical protein
MWEMDSHTCIHLFIEISKYILINKNSFNHCRPNEHKPELPAAQEWQHTNLGEEEQM